MCALVPLLLVGAACDRTNIVSEDGRRGGEVSVRELQPLLDRRAQAIRNKDQQGYLADLDQADPNLVTHERMVFANLAQFEFTEVRLFGVGRSTGTDDDTQIEVYHVLRLSADAAPADVAPAESYTYHLRRHDGKLRILGMRPHTGTEDRAGAGVVPWNVSPLKVVHAGDVWIAADESVSDIQPYTAAAQAQLGKVLALWGDRPHFPGAVLFLSRNTEHLRTWYNAGDKEAYTEGITFPMTGVRKDGTQLLNEFVGTRITVNLANIKLSGDEPAIVIRHELTHAVTFRAADKNLGPATWAVEGFARFVENSERPDRRTAVAHEVAQTVGGGRFNGLPDNDGFYTGPVAGVSARYAISASLFQFIADHKGVAAAVAFFADMRDGVSSDPHSAAFDAVAKRATGMPAATLLAQWNTYVRGLR